MSRKTTHVVPGPDNNWKIIQGGGQQASAYFNYKQDAVDRAREISRNMGSELVIHNLNGKISKCDSHGNDPCPPVDKR